MRNARLDEVQTGIKIAGRNINNLRYADDTTLMTKSEEELMNLLMWVKGESEKLVWNSIFKKLIQPSHPLSHPSPPALNLSQHQSLFQTIGSSHQVAKVLELRFQHQFFQ